MQTMTRIEHPTDRQDELKASKGRVRLLRIPPHRFVMIDGTGPPVPESFGTRMPGLYGTAYGLRFMLKGRGIDGRVGPLEGLWWTTDGSRDLDAIFAAKETDTWRWTLMITLPPEATDDEVETQLAIARTRLHPTLAPSLRTEVFEEGTVAQLMHVGPYNEERPTIELLHAQIQATGFRPTGCHHELYLGDPRRAAPERLRTIIRQPVVDIEGLRSSLG